ncbi:MAG: ABC transporter ATP-binding protein [Nanoarchaeota archaeon]
MQPLLQLKDVKKLYQLDEVIVRALNGLSLDIKKGEFVAIIGPSGSGKSTAMNLIGSLDTPTEGTVLLEGANISDASESELAQLRSRKIGFIFQTFNLIPSISALENVILPMTFHAQGLSRSDRIEKAQNLLEQVGLGERLHNLPSQLSGGERQRVAIARALINNPEIILADEPTGNLDSKTGQEIIQILKKLHSQGKTIILITHDLQIAKQAQRIIKIKDGVIEK